MVCVVFGHEVAFMMLCFHLQGVISQEIYEAIIRPSRQLVSPCFGMVGVSFSFRTSVIYPEKLTRDLIDYMSGFRQVATLERAGKRTDTAHTCDRDDFQHAHRIRCRLNVQDIDLCLGICAGEAFVKPTSITNEAVFILCRLSCTTAYRDPVNGVMKFSRCLGCTGPFERLVNTKIIYIKKPSLSLNAQHLSTTNS